MEDKFQYSYIAIDQAMAQEEIKAIRNKYLPKEEDKLALLRKLDASASSKATMYALVWGFVGLLLVGLGLSCCLVWGGFLWIPGIPLGVIGLVAIVSAYPVYAKTLQQEQEKIAPEILRLTAELIK